MEGKKESHEGFNTQVRNISIVDKHNGQKLVFRNVTVDSDTKMVVDQQIKKVIDQHNITICK